jgi:hypothetical protein
MSRTISLVLLASFVAACSAMGTGPIKLAAPTPPPEDFEFGHDDIGDASPHEPFGVVDGVFSDHIGLGSVPAAPPADPSAAAELLRGSFANAEPGPEGAK